MHLFILINVTTFLKNTVRQQIMLCGRLLEAQLD